MEPGLAPSDRVIVSALAFGPRVPFSLARFPGLQAPERGDLVVVQPPFLDEPSIFLRIVDPLATFFSLQKGTLHRDLYGSRVNGYMVKRIVGMPGDTLRLEGYTLAIRQRGSSDFVAEGQLIPLRYRTLTTPMGKGWSPDLPLSGAGPEITLGDDQYFVLGDNRPQSSDQPVVGAGHPGPDCRQGHLPLLAGARNWEALSAPFPCTSTFPSAPTNVCTATSIPFDAAQCPAQRRRQWWTRRSASRHSCWTGSMHAGAWRPSSLAAGRPAFFRRRSSGSCWRHSSDIQPEEWTVEANPESVNQGFLETCGSRGVTRLSIGVQSLHDERLRLIKRPCTRAEILRSLELVSRLWKGHLNLDYIAGIPGQTAAEVREDLATLLGFQPCHVSLYQLTTEPGTELEKELARGTLVPNSPELDEELWFQGCTELERAGFQHYEISNFCLPRHGVPAQSPLLATGAVPGRRTQRGVHDSPTVRAPCIPRILRLGTRGSRSPDNTAAFRHVPRGRATRLEHGDGKPCAQGFPARDPHDGSPPRRGNPTGVVREALRKDVRRALSRPVESVGDERARSSRSRRSSAHRPGPAASSTPCWGKWSTGSPPPRCLRWPCPGPEPQELSGCPIDYRFPFVIRFWKLQQEKERHVRP